MVGEMSKKKFKVNLYTIAGIWCACCCVSVHTFSWL